MAKQKPDVRFVVGDRRLPDPYGTYLASPVPMGVLVDTQELRRALASLAPDEPLVVEQGHGESFDLARFSEAFSLVAAEGRSVVIRVKD